MTNSFFGPGILQEILKIVSDSQKRKITKFKRKEKYLSVAHGAAKLVLSITSYSANTGFNAFSKAIIKAAFFRSVTVRV